MLTQTSTIVRPVRKSRKTREIHDTCQILYEKVLEASKGFANANDRIQADREAKAILDRADGDNKTNRLAMLRLWLDVRNWVADEAAQAVKKAQALAEYEALVAPVVDGWKAANEAWTKYVQAENAKGHNGQKAVTNTFWSEFARFEVLVLKPRGTEEAVSDLASQLEDLIFRVGNFVWDHWCITCGAPVDEINIVGKKPFWPKLCGTCFRKPADELPEAKPRKRLVKKPGSAGARHKGVAKKAKGKLSAKDEAKNAELLAEASEIVHKDKPNMKGPARERKAGTKTKKNKGIGS